MSRDAERPSGETPADSAGVPWQGRELKPHPFAGDSGQPNDRLLGALELLGTSDGRFDPEAHREAVRAFAAARVFAPVMAELGESGIGPDGLRHDKSAEMAMVTVAAEDGRTAAPAFSGIPQLSAWNTAARPVPAQADRLALAAADEGTQLVILDAGQAQPLLIRRPALWLIAQGRAGEWTPSWADPDIAAEISRVVAGFAWAESVALGPGSGRIVERGPELAVRLRVRGGVPSGGAEALGERLAASALVTERVDSLALSLQDV